MYITSIILYILYSHLIFLSTISISFLWLFTDYWELVKEMLLLIIFGIILFNVMTTTMTVC